MHILLSFGAALLLTCAVEAPVAWLLGLRAWREQAVLVLINIITNPTLNLLLSALAWAGVYTVNSPYDPLLLALEAVVIVAEAALLKAALRKSPGRSLAIAAAANAASWLAGALLLWH